MIPSHIALMAQQVAITNICKIRQQQYDAARRALGACNKLRPGKKKAKLNADIMRKLKRFRSQLCTQ